MKELFGKKVIVLDGAMGTMLLNSGLSVGEKPEMLNLTNFPLLQAQLILIHTSRS